MIDMRLILKLDAVVTGVNGIAYLLLTNPLEDLLGVAPELTRPIGAFLVMFAAGVWLVATRPEMPRPAVATIALANAVWALGSIAFAAADASSPTTIGTAWIVLQALVVAGFAALQALAMRSGDTGVAADRLNSSAISS